MSVLSVADISNSDSDSDSDTDISLDEEDEELIGRVFFSHLDQVGHLKVKDSDMDEVADEAESIPITAEDLQDIDDPELAEQYWRTKRSRTIEELSKEEQKRLLITNLTNDQMERFEFYRRSTINKGGIKRICNGVVGHSIPQVLATVLAGVSKSFVSEIISGAFEVQQREHKAKLLDDIQEKKRRKKNYIAQSLETHGERLDNDNNKTNYNDGKQNIHKDSKDDKINNGKDDKINNGKDDNIDNANSNEQNNDKNDKEINDNDDNNNNNISDNKSDKNDLELSYAGDTPSPLNARHIMESWRRLKASASGVLDDNNDVL
ncbi:transcription initiation factor TFIID subunit 11 [Lodderomyces elongisporus]|uniref:transcription initiation factor TFIID subunit 11 n=1 Tax=Lodderomyces elongisporus TaxID=36914 RepID=UPI00291F2946|nr:transcription initiation factor TFIID subunit 11 [Lodderomyces elongisporus]WLF78827.1 transcription initiation factor TFIID subunit 11 [Lodderomyces elongisporus]